MGSAASSSINLYTDANANARDAVPPSEQERRCASAVCRHLAELTGRQWQPGQWLDSGRDSERSPDVRLCEETDSIAMEITRLTAGKRFDEYDYAQSSLYRRLAPTGAGNFTLFPPPLLELPLDGKLMRSLKAPIRAASKSLAVREWGIVLVPREATVRYIHPRNDVPMFCLHAAGDHFDGFSNGIEGAFQLQDGGTPPHQFLTEKCRRSFHDALLRACLESKRNGQAPIEWREEWKIYRGEDAKDGRSGVVVSAFVSDWVESAAIESVDKALGHAKEKFEAKPWGSRAAVALDASEVRGHISPEAFAWAIEELETDQVGPIDVVFLVVGESIRHRRDFGG